MSAQGRAPLVYALHSGQLYGTERMALATAEGLADAWAPAILAPPGPALLEAERLGFAAVPFRGPVELARALHPILARHRRLAFVATGVVHSLVLSALNTVHRRRVAHLHVVHGGADERLSYGRKRWLLGTGARLVAVSGFVRERLAAHGVPAGRTTVIENFLAPSRLAALPRRPPFATDGVRRVVVVSRLDPLKRVGLLLDALERAPGLAALSVRILGTGWEEDALAARVAARHPGVRLVGFTPDVAGELASADLLVHTCPAEPFGLAILEAMAVGVPALVPDAGGAGALVEDGLTGFRFRAGDPGDLAARLRALARAPASALETVAARARGQLETRFSAAARVADYRALLGDAPGAARPCTMDP